MSCGLGAIILVFVLIKQKSDVSFTETETLESQYAEKLQINSNMKKQLASTSEENAALLEQITALSNKLEAESKTLNQDLKDLSIQLEKRKMMEQKINSIDVPEPTPRKSDTQGVEQDHLIGLQVKGERIGLLIDKSASMTDESLIDIIRRKQRGGEFQKQGPKWLRTVKTAQWLLDRVPNNSRVSVVVYNDNADSYTNDKTIEGKNKRQIEDIISKIKTIVPEGGTNLAAGLEKLSKAQPSNVYVVTDGLPTRGLSRYETISPFSKCSSLWGQSNKISGECRIRLFRHTIQNTKLKNAEINIILLPIEGDPDAAREYWNWSAANNGILISPSKGWP